MTKVLTSAPKTLNGMPVVRSAEHENGYVTVMVEREAEHMPFVVATWFPDCKTSWWQGHYAIDRKEADVMFDEVFCRNRSRGGI